MVTSAWRKRLDDMLMFIEISNRTYFEPNLFRLNINQAITIARTVTFLIQKNKSSIPEYENLYQKHVLDEVSNDEIMKWMVDARNTIEKEGDLKTFSRMTAKIIYSYADEGPSIGANDASSLFLETRQLQKLWSQRAPISIVNESAIAIDRRWVATTLPNHEILDAVLYSYKKLDKAVEAMDLAVGAQASSKRSLAIREFGSALRRTYIKLSNGVSYSTALQDAKIDKSFVEVARKRYENFDGRFLMGNISLEDRANAWADMAIKIFNTDGFHRAMYLTIKGDGKVHAFGNMEFSDRVEKFIFFRVMGDIARVDEELCGIIIISESWRREVPRDGFSGSISNLPIVGEMLTFMGENSAGEAIELSFEIKQKDGKPYIDRNAPTNSSDGDMNIFAPLREAWLTRPEKGTA